MATERRPLAVMESRDERIGVRVTKSMRDELEQAARREGEELSRYVRGCLDIGHKVRQAGGVLKVTVG